jgi:hypothetical protein
MNLKNKSGHQGELANNFAELVSYNFFYVFLMFLDESNVEYWIGSDTEAI